MADVATILQNSLQPSAFLYVSTLSAGTYTGIVLLTDENVLCEISGGVVFQLVMLFNAPHSAKASLLMTLTLLGIVISFRLLHP